VNGGQEDRGEHGKRGGDGGGGGGKNGSNKGGGRKEVDHSAAVDAAAAAAAMAAGGYGYVSHQVWMCVFVGGRCGCWGVWDLGSRV